MRQLILITLTALLLQAKTLATSYMPQTWENLATTAEFIGVVECVTAGGIVARYRAIDSWKGPVAGSEMNIRQHADFFEPQFPISLVGERFLVFAQKSRSYPTISLLSHGGIPLWWREIPTDLSCFRLVPLNESLALYLSSYLGARTDRLDDFKTAVTDFLHCGKAEQERLLLLASARRNLHLPNPMQPSSHGNQEAIQLYDSLQSAKNVAELWRCILEHAPKPGVAANPPSLAEQTAERLRFTLLAILSDGGREQCRDLFEKADLAKLPWTPPFREQALAEIKRNLTPKVEQPSESPDPAADAKKPATPDDIAQAEAMLLKPWDFRTEAAFELLCRHAPDSVVLFLLRRQPPDEYPEQQFGYVLGSAFGHLCAINRTKHLRALQSAADPWIRSAAAVYLYFDEPKEGTEALRKEALIEGDPGAWAALALVSRGDKAVMMRALEVMATPRGEGMDSVNHGNLQKRLRVLLSNAASAAEVPQPPNAPSYYPDWAERVAMQKQFHEALIRWWHENQKKITLADPWSKHLDEQKVD